MIRATSHMRSALATDDPPNLYTTLICMRAAWGQQQTFISQLRTSDLVCVLAVDACLAAAGVLRPRRDPDSFAEALQPPERAVAVAQGVHV